MNARRSSSSRQSVNDLLELVDDENRASPAAWSCTSGWAPGENDRNAQLVARSALERRYDAGSHERRLAAPRRSDDGEEARRPQPGDKVLDELLASEEELAVLPLEGRETLVRTGNVGRRKRVVGQPGGLDRLLVHSERREAAGQAVEDQLEEPLRIGQVLQAVHSEIAQREGGRAVRSETSSLVRSEMITWPPCAAARDARSPVDVDSDVMAIRDERISGVEAHADPQLAVGPGVRGEGALTLLSGCERFARIPKATKKLSPCVSTSTPSCREKVFRSRRR